MQIKCLCHRHYMFCFNTWRPRQNGRSFADDTFKFIFLNENVRISIKNSLKFVPIGPIDNIPEFVHIMVWRPPGEKPLSEPMMVRLPTHICVTRPQWVKYNFSEKRHARDAMLWVHPSSYLDFNITLIYYWFPARYDNALLNIKEGDWVSSFHAWDLLMCIAG